MAVSKKTKKQVKKAVKGMKKSSVKVAVVFLIIGVVLGGIAASYLIEQGVIPIGEAIAAVCKGGNYYVG